MVGSRSAISVHYRRFGGPVLVVLALLRVRAGLVRAFAVRRLSIVPVFALLSVVLGFVAVVPGVLLALLVVLALLCVGVTAVIVLSLLLRVFFALLSVCLSFLVVGVGAPIVLSLLLRIVLAFLVVGVAAVIAFALRPRVVLGLPIRVVLGLLLRVVLSFLGGVVLHGVFASLRRIVVGLLFLLSLSQGPLAQMCAMFSLNVLLLLLCGRCVEYLSFARAGAEAVVDGMVERDNGGVYVYGFRSLTLGNDRRSSSEVGRDEEEEGER